MVRYTDYYWLPPKIPSLTIGSSLRRWCLPLADRCCRMPHPATRFPHLNGKEYRLPVHLVISDLRYLFSIYLMHEMTSPCSAPKDTRGPKSPSYMGSILSIPYRKTVSINIPLDIKIYRGHQPLDLHRGIKATLSKDPPASIDSDHLIRYLKPPFTGIIPKVQYTPSANKVLATGQSSIPMGKPTSLPSSQGTVIVSRGPGSLRPLCLRVALGVAGTSNY
ncbi:hypothetical protein J6590_077113 [Homalodisca vitripennis]|nr:hypothetical protein J6590_077113 [Homalodisca vitripennis]